MIDSSLDVAKIQLRDIHKDFTWKSKGRQQSTRALGGVSFDIQANEFCSVIGPSGCGKTTLLRVVAGLTPADSGQVLIGGREIREPGDDRAVVFQQFGLFPWKTVLDNVKFPLTIQHIPDHEATARAMEQLETVGLADFAGRHPQQLSGGMQQRVGLARALAVNPEILLMDEPFGAIDAQTRTVMQEELMRIWAQSKKTVLFITHDLDEAVLVSDRIVVLSAGPGSVVQEIVPVDLPRPRWEYDVRAHPAYIEARARIWSLLKQNLTVRVSGAGSVPGRSTEPSGSSAP